MGFVIGPFQAAFGRTEFDCGVPALNRYLKEQATQYIRHHYAAMFVAVDESSKIILGYYTLSNTGVDFHDVSDEIKKRLPKYPSVPAIRIGRLAVDSSAQGQGIGSELMADAILRSMSNVAAWAMMIVDAKNEKAVAFYKKFGFRELRENSFNLFIMRQTLEKFLMNRGEFLK
ncbi:MAG: GNAT family N-acetyltransferase [Synergistaceae bacterium]|jgi:ribosomal protein S18 acetylase RimI-like enzyme|nr:GNAT family N-acetyltransferase [Synergistaceae bacterium]